VFSLSLSSTYHGWWAAYWYTLGKMIPLGARITAVAHRKSLIFLIGILWLDLVSSFLLRRISSTNSTRTLISRRHGAKSKDYYISALSLYTHKVERRIERRVIWFVSTRCCW
jgi:hypothetical protein